MRRFRPFITWLSREWPIILVLLATSPLFFYKLGQTSLLSWDEAWYGSIAKNILKSGDWFRLTFNGSLYNDHPQAGFWLMAVAINFLGTSELAVRFASAISGLVCLLLVYLLGKELFSKSVGFWAALSLPTAFWFLLRSRSGNLDIFLTMFFLLTVYLAVLSVKRKTFYLPLAVSLFLLFLTKSMVPLAILPVLLVVFWQKGVLKQREFKTALGLFVLLLGSWLVFSVLTQPNFLRHYFNIGTPGVGIKTDYLANLKLFKDYLYFGIGKWFWPALLGLGLGVLTRQRRFLILAMMVVVFFLPFLFSQKGQIWHLIPLHPFLFLALYGAVWLAVRKVASEKAAMIMMTLIFLAIGIPQYRQVWYQVVDLPAYRSDEEILSWEAAKYPYPIFIDGDFLPAAAYYADRHIGQTRNFLIPSLFEKSGSFTLITNTWEVGNLKAFEGQYRLLMQDRDKVLLLRELTPSGN